MEQENKLYPIKFTPIFKERIWGGNKIKSILGQQSAPNERCGEMWTISCVENEVSTVSEGFLEENDLDELVEIYMGDLTGDNIYQEFGIYFPVLIKFIDSNDWLSVQVHPDDTYAQKEGYSNGKTEMWYVVDAEEGAQIINGFNRDISKTESIDLLQKGQLKDVLNFVNVKKSDVIMIPAGRVHALGKGIMVAEIQQTSDLTYRIYDWDRVDDKGKPRQLHLIDAINVINFAKTSESEEKIPYTEKENGTVTLIEDPAFTVKLINAQSVIKKDYSSTDSYIIYTCVEGNATIMANEMSTIIRKGESVLIPAALDETMIIPVSNVKLLEVSNQ